MHAVDSYGGCTKFIQSMAQKFELPNIAEIPDLVLGSECLEKDGIFILEYSDKYHFDHSGVLRNGNTARYISVFT